MKISNLVIRRRKDRIEKTDGIMPEVLKFVNERDRGHKKLVFCKDENYNFDAIIAVHDTTLGPGLGGCRIWDYRDAKKPALAAIEDVLRLSEAMTYKNSAAGLNLGGGKAVLLKNSNFSKNRIEVLRTFGQFVEYVGGDYVTAEDIGATPQDMLEISRTTKFVTGTPENVGGGGDCSRATATGIFMGMRACCDFLGLFMNGLTVSVQGACGHVAKPLVEILHDQRMNLVITDIQRREKELLGLAKIYNAKIVEKDDIYDVKADIFSPCAMGGVLNDNTIPRLAISGVKIVAGAANNQLEDMDFHGVMVERVFNILYAPDFIINSGGVINIAHEQVLTGKPFDKGEAYAHVRQIYARLLELFKEAKDAGIPIAEMARHKAVLRINKVRTQNGLPPVWS